jgi:hypothetical protein
MENNMFGSMEKIIPSNLDGIIFSIEPNSFLFHSNEVFKEILSDLAQFLKEPDCSIRRGM